MKYESEFKKKNETKYSRMDHVKFVEGIFFLKFEMT